jgi:hypothetical protein
MIQTPKLLALCHIATDYMDTQLWKLRFRADPLLNIHLASVVQYHSHDNAQDKQHGPPELIGILVVSFYLLGNALECYRPYSNTRQSSI